MEKVSQNNMLESKQKLVRAGGLILFLAACGLCIARILSFFLSELTVSLNEVDADIVSNVVFTVLVQVIFLFVCPFLVYKLYLKGKTSKFLTVSNVKPVSVRVCLLAVLVGLFAPVFSMLVNLITNYVFLIIGVELPSVATILPQQFNGWVFVLNIVLTALLPGICEEIANRGIVLSALRSMFGEWAVILLGGLVFGLFHQYIFQFFYTASFGMVLVFITLRTKSSLPAMIIHFTNNLVAVITDFAMFYNWSFQSLQTLISDVDNLFFMILLMLLGVGAFILAIYLLITANKADANKKLVAKLVKEGKIPKEVANGKNINVAGITVLGGPLGDVVYYKPTLKDTVLYWGALAISVFTTVVTLFWYMI